MKKKMLQQLAGLTGTSISTVSKTLNHRPGVEASTRQRILTCAAQHALTADGAEGKSLPPLGAILPDNPKYFWGELYRGLRDSCRPNDCKFNIYTHLWESDVPCAYLKEAEKQSFSLLLLAVPAHPTVREALPAAIKKQPVFLLNEELELPGSFFFGADAFRDAQELARGFVATFPAKRRVLCLTVPNDHNQNCRIQGFCSVFTQGCDILPIPTGTPFSAGIARLLYARFAQNPFDAVYCTDGVLPSVCQAVQKVGLADRLICLGHENPPGNRAYFESGVLWGVTAQDTYSQGVLAMRCAQRYLAEGILPSAGRQCIPSRLLTRREALAEPENRH